MVTCAACKLTPRKVATPLLEKLSRNQARKSSKRSKSPDCADAAALGFPPGANGARWRSNRRREKFVVANADEGDPGAYIDRFLLEDDPHALIEGMLLAAYAVGARKGWIYLAQRISARRRQFCATRSPKRAPPDSSGSASWDAISSFDVDLVVGHGSYVCGEETALIRSIEGRRPDVMARPPYPTEHGLFGKPTLVNNVETLVNVPWIVAHGGEAYRALGFSQSRGTKVVSLNSLFVRPGLYEIEFGVHRAANRGRTRRRLARWRRSEASSSADRWLASSRRICSTRYSDSRNCTPSARASVTAESSLSIEHTSIPELVHHVFSFGAYESCGKCTPCRIGSRRIEEIFGRIVDSGTTPAKDFV